MATDVRDAYSRRAPEYIRLLGSIESVHASDLALVTSWADDAGGPLLDAGCGPGQWTAHLADRGHDIRGVDQAPEFIEHARTTYPGVRFDLGDLDHLPYQSGSFAGVLSWYSTIHHTPLTIGTPLREFARVVRPRGLLLIGFFLADSVEPFDHAVAPAHRWPAEALTRELDSAGFEPLEVHTRTTLDHHPHAAIVARLTR
jgi:SAM-dependent methyltransferase